MGSAGRTRQHRSGDVGGAAEVLLVAAGHPHVVEFVLAEHPQGATLVNELGRYAPFSVGLHVFDNLEWVEVEVVRKFDGENLVAHGAFVHVDRHIGERYTGERETGQEVAPGAVAESVAEDGCGGVCRVEVRGHGL